MDLVAAYPSLIDKRVFITGGATGIGAAMVQSFTLQGAAVIFIDVDDHSASQLVEDMAKQISDKDNHKIKYHIPIFKHCDVTDIEKLKNTISEVVKQLQCIDILVNNVANDQRVDATKISYQEWRQSMAVNLDAAFFAAQTVQPAMKVKGGGSIINFSSINALYGPKDMSSYVTAKAGVLGMTKALAQDFGADNIRVNAVLPGWVITEKQLEKWLTPEIEEKWMDEVCLKKRLLPEHIASLVLFLASDDAAMVTSQEFIIDAGRI